MITLYSEKQNLYAALKNLVSIIQPRVLRIHLGLLMALEKKKKIV